MTDGREVSAPWASEADLPTTKPTLPSGWSWPDLLLLSSELLFGMTGRRFRGIGRSTVRIWDDTPGQWASAVPPWLPAAVGDGPYGWAPLYRGRGRRTVVELPSSPVTQIVTLTIDGVALDPSRWLCKRSGLLYRRDSGEWPGDGTLEVTYDSGQRPPIAGRQHAVKLALELAKVAPGAASGQTSELSNLITSMVREGTSIQTVPIGSAREAIQSGFTGIAAIDQWIKAQDRTRPASVHTPDIPRASRAVPLATTP